jgi:hypothetical protein
MRSQPLSDLRCPRAARSHNAMKIRRGMAHMPDLSEPTALELMGVEMP